jgi:hypothetical protein
LTNDELRADGIKKVKSLKEWLSHIGQLSEKKGDEPKPIPLRVATFSDYSAA